MNKLFYFALLALSLVLACHPSCNCTQGSNVCNSCKLQDAHVDSNARSCPCPPGSYMSQLSPTYTCTKLTNTNESGKDISLEMDACKIEIGRNAQTVKVNTDCHFENIDGKSFVISKASLNFNSISLSEDCKNAYVTSIQIQDLNGNYVSIPAKYVSAGPQGSQTLQFPLIDIFDLSPVSTVGDSQISQTVELKILIGHSDAVVRTHKWQVIVFTNRDQVEVFNLDVTVQETDGCQPGQECIIIADLDTVGQVYTNGSFNVVKASPLKYKVGDIFYGKITFADPTYTKFLKFQKLYFKNGSNKIFNFSSITTHTWNNNGLEFSLPLVEPTNAAVIQINMLIDPVSGGRFLVSSTGQSSTKQFTLQVEDSGSSTNTGANSNYQSSSGMAIIFGLVNIALLFLF